MGLFRSCPSRLFVFIHLALTSFVACKNDAATNQMSLSPVGLVVPRSNAAAAQESAPGNAQEVSRGQATNTSSLHTNSSSQIPSDVIRTIATAPNVTSNVLYQVAKQAQVANGASAELTKTGHVSPANEHQQPPQQGPPSQPTPQSLDQAQAEQQAPGQREAQKELNITTQLQKQSREQERSAKLMADHAQHLQDLKQPINLRPDPTVTPSPAPQCPQRSMYRMLPSLHPTNEAVCSLASTHAPSRVMLKASSASVAVMSVGIDTAPDVAPDSTPGTIDKPLANDTETKEPTEVLSLGKSEPSPDDSPDVSLPSPDVSLATKDTKVPIPPTYESTAGMVRENARRSQIFAVVSLSCLFIMIVMVCSVCYLARTDHSIEASSSQATVAAVHKSPAGEPVSAPACEPDKLEPSAPAKAEHYPITLGSGRYWRDVVTMFGDTWPITMANVVEWYEFGSYGFVAMHITSEFFDGNAVATWLVFAVTFVARPLGGGVIGWLCDKYGRKFALLFSIWGMLVATVGQGLLPTYRQGVLPGRVGLVILIGLRFVQGICAGGQVSSAIIFICEKSPKPCLGMATSFMNVGGMVAMWLTCSVLTVISSSLSEESMAQWGWRVPFISGLVPGLLCIYFQRYLHEEKPEADQASTVTMKEVFGQNRMIAVAAILLMASPATNFWLGSMYVVEFLQSKVQTPYSEVEALQMGNLGQLMGALMCLISGYLTDKYGEGKMIVVSSVCTCLVSIPSYWLIVTFPEERDLHYGIVTVLMPLIASLGTAISLVVVQLFPRLNRGVAVGLTYNIGATVFGGLGPSVAESLTFVVDWGPGIYLTFSGLVSLSMITVLMLYKDRLQIRNVRGEPYPW